MNKFDEALEVILNEHKIEPTAGGHTHCIVGFTPSQTDAIRTALTQAAEIERGDKVVVDREPTDVMLDAYNNEEPHSVDWCDEYFVYIDPVKQIKAYKAMITAGEGK